jgi:5'-nucleotidase
MEILLTNDDSHRSPLFEFATRKLADMGSLRIVVPKEEQSWTGKSITRFKNLYVDEIQLFGHSAQCLDGTPADCINWGIYHLYEGRRPDLVVSGINIGLNTGLGFALSSGTIGACLEANIADIPAVALSQDFDSGSFRNWLEERSLPENLLFSLKSQTEDLLEQTFAWLFARPAFFSRAITWNVNFPQRAAPDCNLVPAFLGHTWYSSCFKKRGDRYYHELEPPNEDQREDSDGKIVRNGHVSVTEIDIRDLGKLGNPDY